MQGKTLSNICNNDSTFDLDFNNYLAEFDPTLKMLLGIDRGKEQKYLNMDGIVDELRAKKILMSIVTEWAKIDLAPYDNSAITTLEEHIKRRWADISASTAGEQYTPDDIISLIADIAAAKVNKPKNKIIHVYDPTCGGANLLFGVADRLSSQAGYRSIATYGSEYNDALYALAAIESRFRSNSKIHYGNTLTTVPFDDKSFDLIVANPPYGTKWSGYEKEIKKDQKGQFPGGLPSVSDGQFLFMQHILWQLDQEGIAIEVHHGSTLFSGDAGSGESNIRKYIFDKDWVEAIIQMPQNEFFNTGIYTYLWIMNKGKKNDPLRKNRVALIDGSNLWQLLKKAKGDKRREMNPEHRRQIVEALVNFQPNDICKIYDREYFYYNKQSLTLTELDDNGITVENTLCKDGSFKIGGATAISLDSEEYRELDSLTIDEAREIGKRISTEKTNLRVAVKNLKGIEYIFDPNRQTILLVEDGIEKEMGCGLFSFKVSETKKGTTWKIAIEPYYTSDYEIIPHKFNDNDNAAVINEFMQKYVFKPYVLTKNVVGVELNFNKEFYVPEQLEDAEDILKEIEELDNQLEEIRL